jgi:hypothetical protein
VSVEFDVIVQPWPRLLPFGEHGVGRQRLQRGPVNLFEPFATRARQFTEGRWLSRASSAPIASFNWASEKNRRLQRRQDPALHHQYTLFHLGLVAGPAGPCRHNCHAVMRGPVLIGAVQLRIPEAGLVHPRLPLIGHDQARGTAEELQHPRMRTDPVRQTARPGGFGVSVVTGTEHGDEDVGGAGLPGGGVDDGDLVAGVVDEDFLAGAMILA